MKNIENSPLPPEFSGKETLAEKSPEEIARNKRDFLSNIVLNAMNEGASTEEIDKFGKIILSNLDLLPEDQLKLFENKGVEGLRLLAAIVDVKKSTAEVKRDTKLLGAEQEAFQRANGIGNELPPTPESEQLSTGKRNNEIGEKSNS